MWLLDIFRPLGAKEIILFVVFENTTKEAFQAKQKQMAHRNYVATAFAKVEKLRKLSKKW
jgi:hypothetical protein